jgi:hypothetical protein
MMISWFENLILLISDILVCPEGETLDVFSVEPVRVVADRTLSVCSSRGAKARRFSARS